MTTILREETLANGLKITFIDESNRYFGDYHRVRVVATILFELQALPLTGPGDQALLRQATEVIGDRLKFVKCFERMGVPSESVDEVRLALVDDFMQNASQYLSRPDYPRSLLKAELNKRGQKISDA